MSEEEQLLDSDDVAAILKVKPRFVRRLVAERRIEFVKAGRSVRFERDAVKAYICRNRVSTMTKAELRAALLAGE